MSDLMEKLTTVANKHFDGHVTIMKFTTNWRVAFGTCEARCDIDRMWEGKTFAEAATAALEAHTHGNRLNRRCYTHDWLHTDGIIGPCPFCGELLPDAITV
jgi:hypothetical protein